MRAELIIEQASSHDFGAIAALNVAAFGEFAPRLPPGSWEAMQANLRNISERSPAQFMVCRESGHIVGSVAYCPVGKADPSIFPPNMAAVLLLAVHPQHRGKGMGKALTSECISRARKDGAVSIGLFTSELMIAAQHIYRGLGFRFEAELPMRFGLRYYRFVRSLAATT